MSDNQLEQLEKIDVQLLHALQYDFPLSKQPYQDIAVQLGITEQDTLSRIQTLQKTGYLRRIGASINSSKLGYVSTLVALQVKLDQMDDVIRLINDFSGVTHNYLREGEYNIWFTVIAPDATQLQAVLDKVGSAAGVEHLMPLPAKRIFKVNVKFPLL